MTHDLKFYIGNMFPLRDIGENISYLFRRL